MFLLKALCYGYTGGQYPDILKKPLKAPNVLDSSSCFFVFNGFSRKTFILS